MHGEYLNHVGEIVSIGSYIELPSRFSSDISPRVSYFEFLGQKRITDERGTSQVKLGLNDTEKVVKISDMLLYRANTFSYNKNTVIGVRKDSCVNMISSGEAPSIIFNPVEIKKGVAIRNDNPREAVKFFEGDWIEIIRMVQSQDLRWSEFTGVNLRPVHVDRIYFDEEGGWIEFSAERASYAQQKPLRARINEIDEVVVLRSDIMRGLGRGGSKTETFVLRDDVLEETEEENKEEIEKSSSVDFDDDFDLFEDSNLF